MDKKYPTNNCHCETDEEWEGRNLLREALLSKEGSSTEFKSYGVKNVAEVMDENVPLYWYIESPATKFRQYFNLAAAERAAAPVRAFLKANGINVVDDTIPHNKKEWGPRDLVRVFANGSRLDPHSSDPATIAMLPAMRRKVWNLVRNHNDKYEF